jgi:hypothetical protein
VVAVAVVSAMGDARAAMAATIGPPATIDPAALPPMILVDAGRWRAAAGVGGWDVDIPVRCIVAPPGDAAALAALEAMVETVLAALGWAPADPGVWAPSPAVDPIPAYTLTYSRQIPNPAC